MIITLTGQPGSGKSTVAKLLARTLNYARYSMGDLRRACAMERGMTIDEWNAHGEASEETDVPVDNKQRELGTSQDNFVIDGRLSWHFIPHAFKVFLAVDPHEGARRIFMEAQKGGRVSEVKHASLEDVQKYNEDRGQSDRMRYQKYYGLTWDDPKQFDLWIDTTTLTPEAVANIIVDKIRAKT